MNVEETRQTESEIEVSEQEQLQFSQNSRIIAENFVGADVYQEFDAKLDELIERDPRAILLLRDIEDYPELAPDPAEGWNAEQVEQFRERTLERIDKYAELLNEHLEQISETQTYHDEFFGEMSVQIPKGVSPSYHQFVLNQIQRVNRIRDDVIESHDGEPADIYDIRGADRRLSLTIEGMRRQRDEARSGERDHTHEGRSERLNEIEKDENLRPTDFPNLRFADIGQYESNEADIEIESLNDAHAEVLIAMQAAYGELGTEIVDVINSTEITMTSQAQVANLGAIASNMNGNDGRYIVDFNELIAQHSSEDLTLVLANEYFDVYGKEKYPQIVSTPEYQLLGFVFHSHVTSEEPLTRKQMIEEFAKPMNLYLLDRDWRKFSPEEREQLDEVTRQVTRGEFENFEELQNEARRYEHMSFGDKPDENTEE